MGRRFSLIMVAAFAVAACSKPSKSVGDDVLTGVGPTVIAYTTQCTEPHPDGVKCNKKTCKAEPGSDCKIFKDRCEQSDHSYDGDDNAGTCTRGDQVG